MTAQPCPFCGAEDPQLLKPTCTPESPYDAADRAFPIVRCSSCMAEAAGTNWDQTGESAIAAWNRRASPPVLENREAAVADLRHCIACANRYQPGYRDLWEDALKELVDHVGEPTEMISASPPVPAGDGDCDHVPESGKMVVRARDVDLCAAHKAEGIFNDPCCPACPVPNPPAGDEVSSLARNEGEAVAWRWKRTGTDTDGDPLQVRGAYGDYSAVLSLSRSNRTWSARISCGDGKLGFATEDEARAYAETAVAIDLPGRLSRARETVALFTHPIQGEAEGMREAWARIIALHGLGTSNGTDRLTPPGTWEQAEWEERILAVIPGLAERRCYALADAILASLKSGGEP